jgi:hypothetical protein
VRGALLGVLLLGGCLFPSLDFTGGDAGTDASTDAFAEAATDAAIDVVMDVATDSGADVATDGGFTAGIGCGAVTPDLLAYYTVDEGAGTAVHDCVSSPQNDGTILNPTHTAWVTGQHGKALEIDPFTGVCVTIDFATPTFTFGGPSAKPFTVAMWIQIIALPPATELGYIAGQSSNISAAGWRFSVAPGGVIQLAVPNGSGGITNVVGPQITAGAWHHIAAVYAGASSVVYLDAKGGSVQALPTSFTADVSADHLRVGCSSDDQHQLSARVDDIRFYNRALSGAEITTVKNAN